MSDASFFSELDYSIDTIRAAMASGFIEKWRCDGAGVQWFKSTGRAMIRAIPPAASAATDLDDDSFVQPDGFLDGDDSGDLEHDHGVDAGDDLDNDGDLDDDSGDDDRVDE